MTTKTKRPKKHLMLADRIMAAVRNYGRGGRVFTPADFSHLGTDVSVRKALSRLAADGKLVRIRQGLYFWPMTSKVLNAPVPPSPDVIVDAIARRDHVTIVPDNIVAANDLGVTNAVPAKAVYLTTGNPMTITVAGQTIRVKKATKAVASVTKCGAAATRVVQAIVWLGKKAAVRSDNVALIRRRLSVQARHALDTSISFLPKWMQNVVRALLDGGDAPQFA
jgi:hypothetical protein